MSTIIIRSKILALVLLWCFVSLIVTEVLPFEKTSTESIKAKPVVRTKKYNKKISQVQKRNFLQIIEEGQRLFLEEMDYEGAIFQFKEAEALANSQLQKSEAYFFLSLVYYATIAERGEKDFRETIRKLIEVDYYRQLDSRLCPPNYIDLFQEIKAEYGILTIRARPPEAVVYINNREESSGTTPLTLGVKAGSIDIKVKKRSREKEDTLKIEAGQTTSPPVYVLKNKSSFLFILGGLALAGGAGVLLFSGKKENGGGNTSQSTTGSIQVNSTPSGAKIYLDGTDTGQITNSTLPNISAGSHTVKLVKEGYVDYETTVSVTANQTTTVDTTLSPHTITVTNPSNSTSWRQGTYVDIYWHTNGMLISQAYPVSVQTINSSPPKKANIHPSLHEISKFLRRPSGRLHLNERSNNAVVSRSGHSTDRVFGYQISNVRKSPTDPLSYKRKSPALSAFPSLHNLVVSSKISPTVRPEQNAHISTISNVEISLYNSAGFVLTIESNLSNAGAITWYIPESLADGSDYKIRIACKDEPSIYGESGTFEINDNDPQGTLSLFLAASSVDGPYNDLSTYGHRVVNNNVGVIYDSQLGRNVYSFSDGGYLEIQDHDILEWGPDDSFTIEINVKLTNSTQGQVILNKGNLPEDTNYSRNYGFSYYENSVHFIYGTVTDGIGNPQNFWTIFTIRLSNSGEGTIKLEAYMDGVKIWEHTDIATNLENKFPLYIGTGYQTMGSFGIQPYAGLMDYVRIYKSLLSENELNNNPTGPVPDYR